MDIYSHWNIFEQLHYENKIDFFLDLCNFCKTLTSNADLAKSLI